MSDLFAILRNHIADRIEEGFNTAEEIIEATQDFMVHDYHTDYYLEHIEQLTADMLTIRHQQEQEWDAPTDCDRLDRAFDLLSLRGIVARQNFTCCQTCGHYEIWEEIQQTEEMGQPVRGYVFYHMQDTESASREGCLFLAYGATERTAESMTEIAQEIIDALQDVGLITFWNGELNKRIGLELEWQRRRFTTPVFE